MSKNRGFTYVKDFDFPSEQGFTGSAGKSSVKGYMRGGPVKAKHERKSAAKKLPMTAKSKGGTVGVTTERGPKSRRPKNTMTKAAGGGSVHDKLYKAGADMGYARGGMVKDTSGEFTMKSKPMASMDSGVQPKRKGRTQADIEAGGTKKLKPRFKEGGKVHRTKYITKRQKEQIAKTRAVGKGGAKQKMPKNVKARGGLAKYADGGSVSPKDLGTGGAHLAAKKIKERESRTRATVDEALAGQRKSRTASPRPKRQVKDTPPKRDRYIYKTDEGGVPTFSGAGPKGSEYKKRARGGSVKK